MESSEVDPLKQPQTPRRRKPGKPNSSVLRDARGGDVLAI